MVSKYLAAQGVFVGRPPCETCGAAYRLHRFGACPEAYRPTTQDEAQRLLERAEHNGDAERVFVARGELQRLRGR